MHAALVYPDFYPDGCPPTDAVAATGTMFRLVRSESPEADDFVPIAKEKPNRANEDNRCRACGLSVFRDVADAHRLRKRVAGHRAKRVAIGTLDATVGVVKATPTVNASSHHTWWVPTDADPSSRFKVISELVGEP